MSTLTVKELSHPAGEVIKIAAGKTLDLKSQGDVVMPTGSVLQVVTTKLNVGYDITTSSSFVASAMTGSITPMFASSKIHITFHVGMAIANRDAALRTTLARNGTAIGGGTADSNHMAPYSGSTNINLYHPYTLTHTDSPNTTSSVAYSIMFASGVAGTSVYASHSGTSCNITLMEIQG